MLSSFEDSMLALLQSSGIPAVHSYPAQRLDSRAPVVCLGVKSARITASGLGNYIGIAEENGEIKEMYGSMADMELALRAYSPPVPDRVSALSMLEDVFAALYENGTSIRESTVSEEHWDSDSGMFRCDCQLKIRLLLVRELLDRELGEPEPGGNAL